MQKILLTLAGICIYVSALSQKVGDLKRGSENHSNNSSQNRGNNSSGQSSGGNYSGGGYSQLDPGCISDGCCFLFNIFSNIDFSDNSSKPNNAPRGNDDGFEIFRKDSTASTPPAEPEPLPKSENPEQNNVKQNDRKYFVPEKKAPFEKINISVRGSFYPANYNVWIPEITISDGHYGFSARLLSLTEQLIDKTDYYSTFDIQPLQINFVNKHNFLFKMGVGGMAETFSSNIFLEFTTNFKWRMGSKFDMGVEGRLATDNGIVRQEASTYLNYALWQKNNKQFLVGLNAMTSQYYQSVSLNTFGFSAGFRF